MPFISHLSPTFSALTYNARLWGNTGLAGGQTTRLYLDDHRRVEQIADRLLKTDADIIGLQEVFCPEMQSHLVQRLGQVYPHHARSLTYDGVDQSIRTVHRRWPRLGGLYERNIQKVVDFFTLSHYERAGWMTRLPKVFVSEDAFLKFLFEASENQFLWGAGLMLFSKHPLRDLSFHPHPARADLEWFAEKGVLKAVVALPERPLTAMVTHIQEGQSPRAARARRRQFEHVGEFLREGARALLLADMNVAEKNLADHREMVARLLEAGGRDCFRAVHPDPHGVPGNTYRVGSDFERALLGDSHRFEGDDQRLDYIFARGIMPISCRVLEREFRGLSDHSPVFVVARY